MPFTLFLSMFRLPPRPTLFPYTTLFRSSRNRRFGLLLAAGRTAQAALEEIGQVVEGHAAAKAIHGLAARLEVEMPLCAGVYRVLYEHVPAKDAVRSLMSRPIKSETE